MLALRRWRLRQAVPAGKSPNLRPRTCLWSATAINLTLEGLAASNACNKAAPRNLGIAHWPVLPNTAARHLGIQMAPPSAISVRKPLPAPNTSKKHLLLSFRGLTGRRQQESQSLSHVPKTLLLDNPSYVPMPRGQRAHHCILPFLLNRRRCRTGAKPRHRGSVVCCRP